MTLDVIAFSFIRPKVDSINIEWDCVDEESRYGLIADKYFQIELAYSGEEPRLSPLSEGDYELTDKSEKYYFRAGSYSTHSRWHNLFIDFAEDLWENGWGEIKSSEPFYFQFEFSSQEGVFGTKACQKMSRDYDTYENYLSLKAKKMSNPSEFTQLYYYFQEAFRIGSKEGVVLLW